MGRYKVADIMEQNVVAATPNESIYDCARKMDQRRVGSLLIIDGGRVAGIITEQDVVRKVVAKGHIPRATPVSVVMSQRVESVRSDEDMERAMEIMTQNGIKHLPVIDNGELQGIVTAKDIVAIEPVLIEMLKFNNTKSRNGQDFLENNSHSLS